MLVDPAVIDSTGKHRERQLARPLAASAGEWKES
jgi:hypothetical protein